MKTGTFVSGRFSALPASAYTDLGAKLQPNQIYEFRMETASMTPEVEAENIRNLKKLMMPGLTVLGIETNGNTIKMQGKTESTFLGITIASVVAFLGAIIWPLISLAIGAIFITRIGEIAWAVVLISGMGIFAYFMLTPKKNK